MRHLRHYEAVTRPTIARVATYRRYSSDGQADSTLEKQDMVIRDYLATHAPDWQIVRDYPEPAQTAKNDDIEDRPVFSRMLRDAEDRQFDVVIVESVDRWARNPAALWASLERLRKAGVFWLTADGLWDSIRIRQQGHSLAFALTAGQAAQVSIDISQKVTKGKHRSARDGFHLGSNPPFGYTYDEPKTDPYGRIMRRGLIPDPDTFPALRRMCELRLAGWGASYIADTLTHEGYLQHIKPRRHQMRSTQDDALTITGEDGKQKRRLISNTVNQILMNQFYVQFGNTEHGTIVYQSDNGPIYYEGKHIYAFTRQEFALMCEVATQLNSAPNAQPTTTNIYPFQGILVCANCMYRMQSKRSTVRKKQHFYYGCPYLLRRSCTSDHTYTRCEVVERVFYEVLMRLGDLWRDSLEQHFAEEDRQVIPPTRDPRQDLEEDKRRLNRMYQHRAISDDEYDRQIAAIQHQLSMLSVEAKPSKATITQSTAHMADIASCWQVATQLERREMVDTLIRHKGLIWHHDTKSIWAISPHDEFMPGFQIALSDWQHIGQWLIRPDIPPSPWMTGIKEEG